MKKLIFGLFLASILTGTQLIGTAKAVDINQYLEQKEVPKKFKAKLADLDVNVSANFGDLEVVQGISLGAKYRYEVEASYQAQFFTRIDKWDLKADINVGDVVENFIDVPFSFSVNRQNSFLFARQFKDKKEALKASPYTPKKLPLSAEAALANLQVGDFVSMPANLNIMVEAKASSANVAPIVVSATANAFFIMSGEFIIQVFKVDETHVRLKMLSRRGYDHGVKGGAEFSFKFFGIRILDKQIDRIFDRDIAKMGYVINPGSQFTIDYVFDLSNTTAKEAYDQILKSTLKFKDLMMINQLGEAKALKDKLISTFDKAEKIFEEDKILEPKLRRVSRIFKGFNDFKGHTNNLKFGFIATSFSKDRAYTENNVTYIDKDENDLEFFYPTFSKYMETKLGKKLFSLKDQSFQNNFGLIPHFKGVGKKGKNPDFGLTFERKDKFFSTTEQRLVEKFMIGQIPTDLGREVDLSQWRSAASKKDARIFFQLILKAQGFNHLKNYSLEELQERLSRYVIEKKELHILDTPETPWQKLKEFLFVRRFIKDSALNKLGSDIHNILQNEDQNPEEMLVKLVKLNQEGIFDKIGLGFLISLLPQDQLDDLIYLKIEMSARGLSPVNKEFGKSNYRTLYKELAEAQSRITDRSYDLRVTDSDHQRENMDLEDDESIVEELFSTAN